MAINDFKYVIIGGSTKCGTTSIYEYLAAHPAVNASIKKESRFFWAGDYTIGEPALNYKDGIEKYEDVFPKEQSDKIRMEATPDYLYSKETAELFKQSVNDCKFVFVLRNPVDRIVSWYKFSRQLNLIDASVSIDSYIKNQFENKTDAVPQHMRAVEQGRYGYYLKAWFDVFGMDSILVCSYDELSTNPKQLMISISRFIKIDASFYEKYDFKIFNKSVNVKDAEQFNKYRTFRRSLRRILKSVPLGKKIKSVLKPVDTLYMNKSTNDAWNDLKISDIVLKELKQLYDRDKIMLEELIKKKVWW